MEALPAACDLRAHTAPSSSTDADLAPAARAPRVVGLSAAVGGAWMCIACTARTIHSSSVLPSAAPDEATDGHIASKLAEDWDASDACDPIDPAMPLHAWPAGCAATSDPWVSPPMRSSVSAIAA